jgi:hypothetical protein
MEERLQINIISQRQQPEINFKLLFNKLRQKYPTAFDSFSLHQTTYSDNASALTSFIKLYLIKLTCKQTVPFKSQIAGTFSYKVSFNEKTFNYYGLKSYGSAFVKGIEKSFEIIEHLLTQKEMRDQIKNR